MRSHARVMVAALSAFILWISARGVRAEEPEPSPVAAPPPSAVPALAHDEATPPTAHDGTAADASPGTDVLDEHAPGLTGFEIGARIGYAVPLGRTVGAGAQTIGGTTFQGAGRDLSDVFSGGLPLTLDAGYRIIPSVYVGAFFSYSFLFINSGQFGADVGCNAVLSCSGHQIDLGANVHFHMNPSRVVDPWIGLGLGYEWSTIGLSANGQSGSDVFSGFQFVNFQLGLDLKPDVRGGLGPFMTLSLGQYDSASASGGGQSVSSDVANKALHEWLTFGVRGVYDIVR
jgi:hypothetical protein